MRQFILSITSKLACLALVLWVGEATAQTTTIRGGSSANTAAVTANALHIICDTGCAGGGGGTQYAEDTAHVSGDSVTMAGVVQQSADAALSTDGDRSVLQVDANGYLKVNIKAGAGSGGTAAADNSAFTFGTTNITPSGFVFDDVAPNAATENRVATPRMSGNRVPYAIVRDAAGNERGLNVDANGEIGIGAIRSALPAGTNGIGKLTANTGVTIGAVEIAASQTLATVTNLATIGTSVTPGTSAAHLGKAEDAAHTSGDTGVMGLCVRQSTVTDLSAAATNGDYEPCQVNASGELYTSANTELPAAAALADATSNPTVPAVGSFNMCWNGATWDRCTKSTAGNGTVDASTQRVTLASDSTGQVKILGLASGATGGVPTAPAVADSFVNVNVSTATTTLLVTGVSGRHVRISSLSLLTAGANNVALISGTGATCGTGTTGMNGGTTAASGWNFAANGGITQGSGVGAINQTNATGDSVCIVTSAATQLSGRLAYAIY